MSASFDISSDTSQRTVISMFSPLGQARVVECTNLAISLASISFIPVRTNEVVSLKKYTNGKWLADDMATFVIESISVDIS